MQSATEFSLSTVGGDNPEIEPPLHEHLPRSFISACDTHRMKYHVRIVGGAFGKTPASMLYPEARMPSHLVEGLLASRIICKVRAGFRNEGGFPNARRGIRFCFQTVRPTLTANGAIGRTITWLSVTQPLLSLAIAVLATRCLENRRVRLVAWENFPQA